MDSIYVYCIIILMILMHPPTSLTEENVSRDEEMTPLAKWLYSPEQSPPPKKIHNYTKKPALILIWKFGPALERRHMGRSHENNHFSPWNGCSVVDCELTYDPEDIERADAVIFHSHWMTRCNAEEIASLSRQRRHSKQLWIFLADESPIHTRIWPEYKGLFNWSMTYRRNSDIPVAYGRTIRRRSNSSIDNFNNSIKIKTKLVAIMGSNCEDSRKSKSNRWHYVQELSDYLPGQLDVYGRCLNGNVTACPGHFWSDCPLLNNYKFYLAFENSNCQEYITEKVFWNAYSKFSVPIIMGPPRIDCKRLLPPHSYIHVDDFPSLRDLADHLLMLDLSDDAYNEYHAWRNDYIVLNEHGYFGTVSRHYCRACEGLHYNPSQKPKTYWNLQRYWNEHQCSTDIINYDAI